MKNLDVLEQKKAEIMNALVVAAQLGKKEEVEQAAKDLGVFYTEMMKSVMNGTMEDVDRTILAGRGVRQLTVEEKEFYKKFIQDASDAEVSPKGISGIDKAFPQTIIDTVMEDIQEEHPLLDAITFVNTGILTKWLINKEGRQYAQWGPINSGVTKELEGSLDEINLTMCKLSAFMFVTQDMLDAGPEWLDRYVRAILVDALAAAMELAAISGTGKDEPIGMDRNIGPEASVQAGKYPQKTAIPVTDLSPVTYGTILSKLAKTPSGRGRSVRDLIMVVNPVDYFKKIMPATTVMTPGGTYQNDVLPYPTKIIQSVGIAEGKAIVGIASRYFMGMGIGKNGRLEYDDSYKFLEDWRTYKIKFLGNGTPMDNGSFEFLDISGLQPASYSVTVNAAENA